MRSDADGSVIPWADRFTERLFQNTFTFRKKYFSNKFSYSSLTEQLPSILFIYVDKILFLSNLNTAHVRSCVATGQLGDDSRMGADQ